MTFKTMMFKTVNNPASHYDVVIVGAGIAGCALACALGDSALNVALIEAQPLSTQWPEQGDTVNGFDLRVSALTPASQLFLNNLGVWPRIVQHRVSPYQDMHVWDAQGTGSIHFSAAEINQPALGHIVENRLILAALLSRIHELPGIELIDDVRVTTLSARGDSINQQNDSTSQRDGINQAGNISQRDGINQVGNISQRDGVNQVGSTSQGNSINQGSATCGRTNGDTPEYQILLDDGRILRSTLVVAADGPRSAIRTQENFATREWDYGHHALVATVQTSRSHQNTAWQRFMAQGPLAMLPLYSAGGDRHFCSIVWSALPQYAEQLMALDEREFRQALGAAFEFQLGEMLAVSQRLRFPLRQRHATDYVKPGIALIGDAAHTIHPLAGQGLNLGLKDVQVLAQEIRRASQRQLNVGSLSVLRRFQRRRKGDNLAMMVSMDGFKHLFAQSALPVRWARNTGMRGLNRCHWLKHRIMRKAMGL